MERRNTEEIRQAVRETYRNAAEFGTGCGCDCGTSQNSLKLGYSNDDVSAAPEGSNLGLGCGNPKAIASLKQGETVLDLGSGAGFDCFLAAKEVGEEGHVIGVDMTPEMLSKARQNKEKGEFNHIEFRLGEIEHLPVANNTVDVIISNCVINLATDKQQVFNEAYRVLKPGGRLAIADIVTTAVLPQALENDLQLYAGCMSGALFIDQVQSILEQTGFVNIRITPKGNDHEITTTTWTSNSKIEDHLVSAYIEAEKIKQTCC